MDYPGTQGEGTKTLTEWGPRPAPEPPPWTDAHPDPPYCFEVRSGVRTLGGGGGGGFCHALVKVFCVYLYVLGQARVWHGVFVLWCVLSWGFGVGIGTVA